MTLPGGVTPVTITGKVTDHRGVSATGGSVTFRMPYPLSDGTDHVVLAPGVWSTPIASNGMINNAADPLAASTSAGVSPAGWAYEVTVRAQLADATTWYRQFFAVINASTSFEQLLAAAAHTPTPGTAYVPLSAVGTTVAPLVGGKVPLTFLPPGGGGSGIETITAANGTIVVDATDPLNPTVRVGTGIPQASVATLTSDLGTLTAGISSAVSTANGAATTAAAASTAAGTAHTEAVAAQATADAAQSTASAAYVKPGLGIPPGDLTTDIQGELALALSAYQEPIGGIPEADLAAAVQALLAAAGTAYQRPVGGIPFADLAAAVQSMLAPQIDAHLTALGFHASNIPLYVTRSVSVIGNETWYARVLVRRGQPIGHVATYRSKGTAAALGAGGLNGFSVWSGDATTLLASTVSDDSMWLPPGKVVKPISGIATPTVDTFYWVAAHVNGYSTAPEFMFQNLADSGLSSDAGYMSRYKGGSLTVWPASFDPDVDLTTGSGYILPLFLGA